MTMRRMLPALLLAALVAPAALAHHTAPGYDAVYAGDMKCTLDERTGRVMVAGVAQDTVLPILRTTDNGHLHLDATGFTSKGVDCKFEVVITGFTVTGINPQGGITSVTNAPCGASNGASCIATADADWWVNFVGPDPTSYTPQIDILFELRVNGIPVDNGFVRIVEPSLPALPLP